MRQNIDFTASCGNISDLTLTKLHLIFEGLALFVMLLVFSISEITMTLSLK